MINDSNHSWPPFAADILIELWNNGQNDDDYFVKIYYCNKVNFILSFANIHFNNLIN
jgi:hypothetical protein